MLKNTISSFEAEIKKQLNQRRSDIIMDRAPDENNVGSLMKAIIKNSVFVVTPDEWAAWYNTIELHPQVPRKKNRNMKKMYPFRV